MALTNKEKRVLLVCLKFMYLGGGHYVAMLQGGTEPGKQICWEECRKIIKKLYKQIKQSIQ
jgi:hypothetical protein